MELEICSEGKNDAGGLHCAGDRDWWHAELINRIFYFLVQCRTPAVGQLCEMSDIKKELEWEEHRICITTLLQKKVA